MASGAHCYFFDLPAELRNKIYTYALVKPKHVLSKPNELNSIEPAYDIFEVVEPGEDAVNFNQNSSYEPALLRTCNQIRTEASPIFFGQNSFYMLIENTAPPPQPYHWTWTKVDRESKHFEFYYGVTWVRLWAWLRLAHQKKITLPGSIGAGDDVLGVVQHAFEIAFEMHGVPWETTKEVLRLFKGGAEVASQSGHDMRGAWGWSSE